MGRVGRVGNVGNVGGFGMVGGVGGVGRVGRVHRHIQPGLELPVNKNHPAREIVRVADGAIHRGHVGIAHFSANVIGIEGVES